MYNCANTNPARALFPPRRNRKENHMDVNFRNMKWLLFLTVGFSIFLAARSLYADSGNTAELSWKFLFIGLIFDAEAVGAADRGLVTGP